MRNAQLSATAPTGSDQLSQQHHVAVGFGHGLNQQNQAQTAAKIGTVNVVFGDHSDQLHREFHL